MGNLFSTRRKRTRQEDDGGGRQEDDGGGYDGDAATAVIAVHSSSEWSQHWQSHSQSDTLMVIDFSASWCGPCRFIEPEFKKMSVRFVNAVFFKIDVDELRDIAEEWKVQAMPTFVLVKRGKEVGRVVGANKEELEKAIQSH